MAMSPLWVPLSASRSTNSLLSSASASVKVGLGTSSVHGGSKLVARTKPLPTDGAHADDVVRALLTGLAHRVEGVLGAAALDTNLLPDCSPDRLEPIGVG